MLLIAFVNKLSKKLRFQTNIVLLNQQFRSLEYFVVLRNPELKYLLNQLTHYPLIVMSHLNNKRVHPTKNEPQQQGISYLEREKEGVRERQGQLARSAGRHI
jgi:hypothetical protein